MLQLPYLAWLYSPFTKMNSMKIKKNYGIQSDCGKLPIESHYNQSNSIHKKRRIQ